MDKRFGDCCPVFSYVAQPPLNASLVVEVHGYIPDIGEDRITYSRINETIPYVILENSFGRFLFAGGLQENDLHADIAQQAVMVFRLVGELLKHERFPFHAIVRQWNYIERITAFDNANQHYQSFNNARSDFYNTVAYWQFGYPAATGIGTDFGGVLIDFDAIVFNNNHCSITPIDNQLQVSAHAYSRKVLEKAGEKKATPKFERAKKIVSPVRKWIYISGTAAIRGEKSLHNAGLKEQLCITMENISYLIDGMQLELLRVYVKNKSDYEEAQALMNTYGLDIPVSYLCADVCRNELLIEIEGIAVSD
jgi:hypothetical protein